MSVRHKPAGVAWQHHAANEKEAAGQPRFCETLGDRVESLLPVQKGRVRQLRSPRNEVASCGANCALCGVSIERVTEEAVSTWSAVATQWSRQCVRDVFGACVQSMRQLVSPRLENNCGEAPACVHTLKSVVKVAPSAVTVSSLAEPARQVALDHG